MSDHLEAVAGSSNSEARARELVLRFGWNATAYQIINPGIELWFSSGMDAVAGYVVWGRYAVVAGAPVSAPERLLSVMEEFEEWAGNRKLKVCYFGAGKRLESIARENRGYSMISLGAQPEWDPACWPDIVASKESLRAQLNRARNKGVSISQWPSSRATDNSDLRRCLAEWLDTRGLPPLHFLVEPETLNRLEDRKVFVAERDGSVVGFLVLSPVPARNGWLVEQIIRGSRAPNGTSELLLDSAMRESAKAGANYLTLGLSPLSENSRFDWSGVPRWLRLILSWLRVHGKRFYNFEGLDQFKAKFQPSEWEDISAIVNRPKFSLSALYSIAGAFGGRSPFSLLAIAFASAIRREVVSAAQSVARMLKARSATPR
jgi:phosphatidylglycerol lysyltransferase